MFDWNNLFWSCAHCNSVKNQKKYDDGILDCCKTDPEMMIFFRLKGDEIEVTSRDLQNMQAVRTAELVEETFNLRNTGMRIYTSDIRCKGLQQEMNVLFKQLEKYKKELDCDKAERKLKALLRRESNFAGFKRCYVREHSEEYPELLKYLA